MRPGAKCLLVALLGATALACALPEAARQSSRTLKEGWDTEANGFRVLVTGPTAILRAAGELARYSIRPPEGPESEPPVKWFRFYDIPMQPAERVAILCHLDQATHVATIRKADEALAVEARFEAWHYPACIEVLAGDYEITVSYYSRKTVESGMFAKTTTTESTTASTTQWHAEQGVVYVLAAVMGRPALAPGDGPAYKTRRRTQELWDTEFKLEVSHWKAAIVELPPKAQLDASIKAHRETWRQYEELR
jgi:hypothetical protein